MKRFSLISLLFLASAGQSILLPAQEAVPPPAAAVPAAHFKALGVVRLEGSPEEIGRRHGQELAPRIKLMLREYAQNDVDPATGKLQEKWLKRIEAMKPSLPDWYRQELAACAKAAGVDEDLLLFGQCEGDIKGLNGCTTYVAFAAATPDGKMEIGRNFDYWGLESPQSCCVVLAVIPRPEDGHAFVSVGWTGILGGWTFYNDQGLFVANNLSRGPKDWGTPTVTDPKGIPTLILERIVAQKAGSIDEAIKIIKASPRMRGQALVIGQAADEKAKRPARAVVVLYDGDEVQVTEASNGFAFHSSIRASNADDLRLALQEKGRQPFAVIRSAGSMITLHSVAIRPSEHAIWVAHGTMPGAHEGKYVKYDLRKLLERKKAPGN